METLDRHMGNSVQHLPARTVVPMVQAPQMARQVKAVPAAAKVDLAVYSVAQMRARRLPAS